MARRKRTTETRPSAYDSLIDAERDALLQAGRKASRGDLIRALLEATDLSAAAARRVVAGYVDRRGGLIPSRPSTDDTRSGWLDDLLDAERVRAARDDQSVTPRTLVRAVRQASPDLTARAARAAVADYLYRRGGRPLRPGKWRLAALILIVVIGLLMTWMLSG